MASVRSLENALEVSQAVRDADGLDEAKITGDDGRSHIPQNGRLIQNLIHGADTVMSHILHLYHLTALDYVDGRALGPYLNPAYTASQYVAFYNSTINASLVTNYLEALKIRRKAHTLGAIFSGRQPIQHAMVPGGASTLPSQSDIDLANTLLDQIREFIDNTYIPDVVQVAETCVSLSLHSLTEGPGTGNLLSYGDFPCQTGTSTELLLIARGVWTGGATGSQIAQTVNIGPTELLDQVIEDTTYSYYSNTAQGLHPHKGQTNPNVDLVKNGSGQYSWLKAPRIDASVWSASDRLVCEVGPMPRMVISALGGGNIASVAQDGGFNATFAALGSAYDAADLVTAALGATVLTATSLFSVLGRHAARALEAKLVADAMKTWLADLEGNLTGSTYVYAKLPTKPKKGSGWAEAPRGALGHWITIDKKRIVNYQCVVPSTWNHSPMDDDDQPGAAETVVTQLTLSGSVPYTDADLLKVVRSLHCWDFCIACAVHIVKPDGSTIAKYRIDPGSGISKLPNDAQI